MDDSKLWRMFASIAIMDKSDNRKKTRNDEFISLLMENQNRIYGFIRVMVPQKAYADDLMQETAMIMWRKFDEFKLGTGFASWGMQVARYEVYKFRKKQKNNRILFTDDVFDEIMQQRHIYENMFDERLEALENCVKKLKDNDKTLIKMRYTYKLRAQAIAKNVGRSVDGIYKSFSRIHFLLRQCVVRGITSAGGGK